MSEHKDKSPLVEITVHATDILFTNCDYPEPTKEMIIEKMRELLDEGNITYSEKRMPQTSITSAIEKINNEKAALLYSEIDRNPLFEGHAELNSRSNMNVTFRLTDDLVGAKFDEIWNGAGISGIKGHRSLGGIRVSLYNSVDSEMVDYISEFISKFFKKI